MLCQIRFFKIETKKIRRILLWTYIHFVMQFNITYTFVNVYLSVIRLQYTWDHHYCLQKLIQSPFDMYITCD